MKKVVPSQTTLVCSALIAAVFALLPFHAVLTVWAGSNFGHYDWFRLWIELLLVPLTPLTLAAVYGNEKLRAMWRRDALVWVCLAYICWQVVLGLFALHAGWVNRTALLTGWATDLRFIAFLLICWAIASQRRWLAARWRELLLLPAAAVTLFGALQAWLLPADILRHVGYGKDTIQPFSTVDQKAAYVRVQSTLRGPNPLGAYMAMVITALAAQVLRKAGRQWRIAAAVFLALAFVVLGATYSRSAYIGTALSLGTAAWLLLTSERAKTWLLVAAGVFVLVAGAAFAGLRHNDQFQNTFFHTDEHSHSGASSNAVRTSALTQGARDMLDHPLGRGPGSAGPASVHNSQPPRIAENYYLQIGQESGWLGLGLFLAANVLVVLKLWQRRGQQLAIVLLASLVGISFINLLSHAWADETLGMLWWGFAGIALSLPLARAAAAKSKKVGA
jgi:hypothetical protein